MKSLPNLPSNATIVDAKLKMSVTGVSNGPVYIGIYRVTSSWSADLLTYSSKPTHYSTPIDYQKVGGAVSFEWDITTLMNQWKSGTYPNYGVLLSMMNTSDSLSLITFKSERASTTVPSFVITYRDTKGVEPYYSYYSSGADLAGTGKVNAFTGNLAFIHSSISTTDEILPYTISLAYNSCLSGKNYDGQNVITPISSASTGKGFKLSFDETVKKIVLENGDELYVWADADGTEHYFSVFDYVWVDEDLSGYCDEDGLGLYLSVESEDGSGTGYLMTDDTGNKKHFDDEGYLDYVEDSNGNRRFFQRDENNKVISISLDLCDGTEFTQLQLTYTSANGVLKTVTSVQTGLTANMYYSSTYNGEATQNTSGFLRKITYTYATNYTYTVSYEYDSTGRLILVKDLKSGAAVNYTYDTTGKVTAITQYGNATETSTVATMAQGQRAQIHYGSLYSYYRTPGTDLNFVSSDDVYTYYHFDHSGRVISSYTKDSEYLYGAANCIYEDDTSVKKKNALSSIMQLNGNTVNYLNNPGFEEINDDNKPKYWHISNENYFYKSVNENTKYLTLLIDGENNKTTLSQSFKLIAGTYTASAFFNREYLCPYSQARIAIYNSSNNLVAASDYVTAFDTDAITAKIEEQKSVTFTIDDNDCFTNGWLLVIEFAFEEDYSPSTTDFGSLGVDSVMLEKSSGAGRYSILGNGGFENRNSSISVTSWTLKNTTSISNGFDGHYRIKVTGNPEDEAYAKTTLIIDPKSSTQSHTMTPESYVVSGWASADSAKTDYSLVDDTNRYGRPVFALKAIVHYVGSAETTTTYIPFDDHNTDWQFATGIVTSTLPLDGGYRRIASIDIYCCYDYNINTAYFDSISVVKDTNCVTRYTYNDYGYVSNVGGSDGNSTSYTYDSNELDVNQVSSSNGNSIDFDYDDNHRLISEINTNATNNFKIEYTYNDYGKVVSTRITNNTGAVYSINSSVDFSTSTVNFGAVIEETDENDRTVKTFYDEKARITGSCGNDGFGVLYTYNKYGQIVLVKEAVYDAASQTMKAFSGSSYVTSTYNSKGNTSSIYTRSATYTFGYDDYNNVTKISVNGQDLLSITFENCNGNVSKIVYGNDDNDDWEEYQYDNVDRISEVWYNSNTEKPAFTYIYNANGNLSEHTDNINGKSYTYTYDQKGSLTQRVIKKIGVNSVEVSVACVEQYTYDDQGRITNIYYNYLDTPEVKTLSNYQFTYDVAGNTTKIDYGGTSGHSNYAFDAFGRLDEETLTKGSSATEIYSKKYNYSLGSGAYTTSYQVDSIWIDESSGSYYDTYYEYDDVGNITSIEIYDDDLIQQYTYKYDDKNQLIRENVYIANSTSASRTITYSYDTSGNITSKKRYSYTEAEDLTGLTYTASTYGYATDVYGIDHLVIDDKWNDLLTSFNGSTITYDEMGNPKTYGGYTYNWTNGRQLASVYQVSPYVNTTYQYNDEGIRTVKTVNGVKHEYTVSGGQINREVIYSSNGQYVTKDLRYYYDAAGNPTAIRAFTRTSSNAAFTDTKYYLRTNMQGDVVAIYNENGDRIFEYVYDAWGNILRSTQVATGGNAANNVNPFRYRGYYYDTDTGLYYLQTRYYNPQWGRFLNADNATVIVDSSTISDKNMFAYCDNNPVMRSDDGGEFWHIVAGAAVGAVVGGLSSIISQAIAGEDINWTAVAISAASGAVSGAVNAAFPCMGALATGVIEGTISAVSYAATESLAYGRDVSLGETLKVGLTSGFMAGAGKAFAQSIGICNCFVAGTLVAVENGYVTIESIKAGDLVWATNPDTGETALKPVVQTFTNQTNELVHVTVNGETITCTNEHPFYSPVKGWIAACQLRAGDVLVMLNGEYVVVEQVQHELLESPVAVYNFEVEGFHTYYVGDTEVLVHNKCRPDLPKDGIKLDTNDALDLAGDFLGDGYSEASPGRFVSADKTRQVRIGDDDILGGHAGGPHINFEIIWPKHKTSHVYIK
jgi:RHS repeat-associated protein